MLKKRELTIERDMIDVTKMPTFITVHKKTGKQIPLVYRGKYWCTIRYEWIKEYSLDKRFSPRNFVEKQVSGWKEYAPGITRCYIDGQQVTREEFDKAVSEEMRVTEEQSNKVLCDGCNVRPNHMHRCHNIGFCGYIMVRGDPVRQRCQCNECQILWDIEAVEVQEEMRE